MCPPHRHDIAHIASSLIASLALAFFYPYYFSVLMRAAPGGNRALSRLIKSLYIF